MCDLFYQVEIKVIGGPRGYSYEDVYKTEVKSSIDEVRSQAYIIDSSVEVEKFERYRVYTLKTLDKNMNILSSSVNEIF